MIRPGQAVLVSGDPSLPQAPSWGGGGFTVQERGSLALAGVAVAGAVSVLAGGDLTLQSSTVLSGSLSVTGGTARLRIPQAFANKEGKAPTHRHA